MTELDLSVVIGFRDWGAERLRRSVRSIQQAVGALSAEVIISDYGSAEPAQAQAVAAEAGARVIYTPGDRVWSRSRALNAGFGGSAGRLLVATDADMLFSPGSLEAIHEAWVASAPCALFLQCRDLPEGVLADPGGDPGFPWESLELHSTLRPRWGMGGMMAIDRAGFSLLNGFDERLHTYGREDLDFALRARRAGYRTAWVQDPRVRMYHMWHPQTQDDVGSTAAGREAVVRNRRLIDSDATTTRNVGRRTPPLRDAGPLVSILVLGSSSDRSRYRTVATALAQTVQNVEVIISSADSVDVSLFPPDPRVRVLIHASTDDALREALAECRGAYASVVHAGDLLALDRTESLLDAVVQGASGAVGAIAGAGADGSLVLLHEEAVDAALVRTSALQAVVEASAPTSSTAGLLSLLRRAGYAMSKLDRALSVRPSSVVGAPRADGAPAMEELRWLLPDDLNQAGRDAQLARLDASAALPDLDGAVHFAEVLHGGEMLEGGIVVRGASYDDLVALARVGSGLTVTAPSHEDGDTGSEWVASIVRHAIGRGKTLPIRLHRSEADSGEPDSYVVRRPSESFAVEVSDKSEDSRDRNAWLMIGAQIEEVWS